MTSGATSREIHSNVDTALDDATGVLAQGMERIRGSLPSLADASTDVGALGGLVGERARQRPLEALLLAASLGYLFGWLVIRD